MKTKFVVLCKKQELKSEKLKEKALYYTSKSLLLERYDPAVSEKKKKELDGNKRKKRIEERDRQKGLR